MTDRRAGLLALLTDYQPSDADEQRYRMQMLDLAAAAHDPFDRHAYEPGHFTASGFVIHPDGGRLLLIQHAKIQKWLQPGGHIDPTDADPLAGARREVEEETGIGALHAVSDRIVDIDIHEFPERPDQPGHLHFDVRFAFVAESSVVDHNDEADDARWVGLADLAEFGADRSVIRPAHKLLGSADSPNA